MSVSVSASVSLWLCVCFCVCCHVSVCLTSWFQVDVSPAMTPISAHRLLDNYQILCDLSDTLLDSFNTFKTEKSAAARAAAEEALVNAVPAISLGISTLAGRRKFIDVSNRSELCQTCVRLVSNLCQNVCFMCLTCQRVGLVHVSSLVLNLCCSVSN